MDNLKNQLIKSFDEPNGDLQLNGILNFIKNYYEQDNTNQSEFLINLRDYLLNY